MKLELIKCVKGPADLNRSLGCCDGFGTSMHFSVFVAGVASGPSEDKSPDELRLGR